jgi:hypothetical protein
MSRKAQYAHAVHSFNATKAGPPFLQVFLVEWLYGALPVQACEYGFFINMAFNTMLSPSMEKMDDL